MHIVEQFNSCTAPIFDYLVVLREEVLELLKIRGDVLPLLMNGQVEVAG